MRPVLYVALLLAVLVGGCGTGGPPGPGGPAADDEGTAASTYGEGTAEPVRTVPPLHPSVDGYPGTLVTLTGPDGATERVAVKLADTPERRQHGLMEVEELPEGAGMLFVFGEEHTGAFWMKDTLIPLSIAFIASDGGILEILQMEPCEEEPCELYDPGVAYRYALEVPQGWFAEVGIDEDWTVERPLPGPAS